jgi:hypothetical protein
MKDTCSTKFNGRFGNTSTSSTKRGGRHEYTRRLDHGRGGFPASESAGRKELNAMSYRDTIPSERRIVVFATEKEIVRIHNRIAKEIRPELMDGIIDELEEMNWPFDFSRSLTEGQQKKFQEMVNSVIHAKKEDFEPPLFIHFKIAAKMFDFPPGHPIDGTAYACCEVVPYLYVPIASFHELMWQNKMSSFSTLCSRLGAKFVKVSYAEEDGKDISGKIGVSGVAEASAEYKKGHKVGARIFREYDLPEQSLVETGEGWLVSEPTWISMQEERIHGNLRKSIVEVNYDDEMGISSEVAATFKGIGIKIGGSYKDFSKKKWIFEVEFWPKKDMPKKKGAVRAGKKTNRSKKAK